MGVLVETLRAVVRGFFGTDALSTSMLGLLGRLLEASSPSRPSTYLTAELDSLVDPSIPSEDPSGPRASSVITGPLPEHGPIFKSLGGGSSGRSLKFSPSSCKTETKDEYNTQVNKFESELLLGTN